MTIGQNIFELRKNRKLTQSELAAKLGVSEQSISKWENDICSPDVSVFPQLAKLFNVSIDRLFGFHLDSYDKEVQIILDADRPNEGPHMEIAYLEKALARYPNSDKIKLSLAFAYSMLYRVGETEDEKKSGADKAISICEEILGTSFDETMLDEAYFTLARIYTETGSFEKAQDMLGRISSSRYCAKIIGKSQIFAGSKKYDELRYHTENTLFEFYMVMNLLLSYYCGALQEQGLYKQALQYCDLREKILCLFDARSEILYTSAKIGNAFQKACILRELDRKEECYHTLQYLTDLTIAAALIPDTGHQVSALNGFFKTVEQTEEHYGAANVQEYTSFMLSQLKKYFEGDVRFDTLMKKVNE